MLSQSDVYDINRLRSAQENAKGFKVESAGTMQAGKIQKLVADDKQTFAPVRAYDAPHTVTISIADWNAMLAYLRDAARWNAEQGYDAIARQCNEYHQRISKQCRTAIRAAFNDANAAENPDDGARLSDRYADDY